MVKGLSCISSGRLRVVALSKQMPQDLRDLTVQRLVGIGQILGRDSQSPLKAVFSTQEQWPSSCRPALIKNLVILLQEGLS